MKTKKKLTKAGKILLAVLIVLVLLIVTLITKPWNLFTKDDTGTPTAAPSSMPSASAVTDTSYAENIAVNPEYIGHLKFDSGLLDQNVVQADDNEKYLSLAWDLAESTHGAAFLDYRNTLDDQNLIIYGHFVYADESLMFGPLTQLNEEANYEANKTFTLSLENETREYLITDVFYYVMDSETLQYYYTYYDEDYFNTYYAAVKEADFYDTGESLTMDDHWISLQTCVRNRDDLRLIVLAKEVN